MDLSLEFTPDESKDMVIKIRGSILKVDAKKKELEVSAKPLPKQLEVSAKPQPKQRPGRKDVMKDAINEDGTVKLRILVDRGSIEVFLNDGITVLTHSIIHELEDTKISFEDGGKTVIKSMEINEVTSSWKNR